MLRNLANATSGEVDIIDIGDDGDDDGDDEDERMFIKSNTSSRSMKKLLSDVAVVVIFKDGHGQCGQWAGEYRRISIQSTPSLLREDCPHH